MRIPDRLNSKWPRFRFIVAGAAVLAGVLLMPGRLWATLPDGVELRDMSWVEVRSAVAAGYTTVIVPSGGIEQNGPHMVLGKHDYIVSEAARRIAKDVGRTLVAPVISYVPQGTYDPPTGNLQFPGTIGVPQGVFEGVLDGAARSLKLAGFKTICFIGDHGESQPGQAAVAKRLTAEWAKDGVRVLQVAGYYDDAPQVARLEAEGHSKTEIGRHASLIDTSELLSVDPKGVNLTEAGRHWTLEPTGVIGDPSQASANLGAQLLAMRINAAVAEIKQAVATH
jgi:creatinine amidohydrolase/Fe(II)-dependent formamide hydrolase-like protein